MFVINKYILLYLMGYYFHFLENDCSPKVGKIVCYFLDPGDNYLAFFMLSTTKFLDIVTCDV